MSFGTAASKDGTRIVFWREGSRPPLLLVHGGACDHMAWYYVLLMGSESPSWLQMGHEGRAGGVALTYGSKFCSGRNTRPR